ncbi:MAG: hypothetical protein GY833_16435 [Aestuariibacter sp.]|nr:hypothetical protein [Aestuariibacter sp.]
MTKLQIEKRYKTYNAASGHAARIMQAGGKVWNVAQSNNGMWNVLVPIGGVEIVRNYGMRDMGIVVSSFQID